MIPNQSTRPGFSLLEMILFFGIVSIIIGTVISISISTEEARIRQKAMSEVEQRGTQILETVTKSIRRSEQVLLPTLGATGSILALQMTVNGEFPTMFTETGTGNLLLIQKTTVSQLLSPRVTVSNLQFRNVNETNVVVSFDLTTVIPLLQKTIFTRHLEATATLFSSDHQTAGGCNSCPPPFCENHTEKWYVCEIESCVLSESVFSC